MIKIIAHDTTMKIPIFNSFMIIKKKLKDQINIKKLNNLKFKKVDTNKFPSLKLLKNLQKRSYLKHYCSANDELVNLFLIKKLNLLI